MKRLVLASASPRRQALLAQLGLEPAAIVPAGIDEAPHPGELPRAHAERIAREKLNAARAEVGSDPDLVLLAADTVVAVGRRILPKAETVETARQCLHLLSGRSHRVYTAVCIADHAKVRLRTSMTRVSLARLSDADIEAYLATGDWHGKAGGYAIQGHAAAFIRNINGSYSGVVGLPLYETANLLRAAGINPYPHPAE